MDLDAILGELCALETQCEREIGHARDSKRLSGTISYYFFLLECFIVFYASGTFQYKTWGDLVAYSDHI